MNKNIVTCEFDYCDLILQAEGGMDGWVFPVWASVVKDEHGDYIDLTLGAQVSQNTSFYNNTTNTIAKSWVGSIPTWHRHWEKDDAELWAEEFGLDPSDFDSDEETFNEVQGYYYDGRYNDAIEELKQSIIEYARSEGYDEVEF